MEERIQSATRRPSTTLTALLLCLIMGLPASDSLAQEAPAAPSASCMCTKTSAKLLAELAFATGPLNEEARIVAFVKRNKVLLRSNEPTIRCARELGAALLAEGMANLPKKSVWDQAYESAISSGADMEQARKVADAAARTDDPALVQGVSGDELLWLAKVIPEAAKGNWEPYWRTGGIFRQGIRAEVLQYRAYCEMMELMGMGGYCAATERDIQDFMLNTLPHILYSWSCSFPSGR